ncbi:hypothetical protein L1887_27744 [Cichorium endivia]|nr:hypothetical protein L1887_27744 [Cichorium endivia]
MSMRKSEGRVFLRDEEGDREEERPREKLLVPVSCLGSTPDSTTAGKKNLRSALLVILEMIHQSGVPNSCSLVIDFCDGGCNSINDSCSGNRCSSLDGNIKITRGALGEGSWIVESK